MSSEDKAVAKGVSGTVKWFDPTKDEGFISRGDSGEDCSAISTKNPNHYDASLAEGDVVLGQKGLEASNITGPRGTNVVGNDQAASGGGTSVGSGGASGGIGRGVSGGMARGRGRKGPPLFKRGAAAGLFTEALGVIPWPSQVMDAEQKGEAEGRIQATNSVTETGPAAMNSQRLFQPKGN